MVYSQSEWAARDGKSKNFEKCADIADFLGTVSDSYAVGATKTLFLTGCCFIVHAQAEADADKNQMGCVRLYDQTDAKDLVLLGGNGGNGVTFSTPIVIPGGHTFEYTGYNLTNHGVHVSISLWGYEV